MNSSSFAGRRLTLTLADDRIRVPAGIQTGERFGGSPRISGIEAVFEDGELVFSSMPNARKGADLRRDPRFALHSATVDPVEGSEAQWPGEAKISGRAIAAAPISEGADGDRFHAEIAEVVHTHLNEEATMLVVEWWTPTHGLRRIE